MPEKHVRSIERKKVLPPTYLLVSIVLMVLLRLLIPVRLIVRLPWTLLGLLPAIAGVVLNLRADQALKKHQTTVKPFEKSTALVVERSYAVSRHPMYLGFTLILLGIALLLGAVTCFAVVPAFALLMEFTFVRAEERMMEEAFGADWLAYKAKVRRWI